MADNEEMLFDNQVGDIETDAGYESEFLPAIKSIKKPESIKRSLSSNNLSQAKTKRSHSASKSRSLAQPAGNPTKSNAPPKTRLSRFMSSDQINFSPAEDSETSARALVERAIRERKVFTIVGGYKPVRKGLRRRNYIEKVAEKPVKKAPVDPNLAQLNPGDAQDADGDNGDNDASGSELDYSSDSEEESPEVKNLVSRIIRNVSPTFMWTTKVRTEEIRNSKSLYNHFPATWCFTTKNGLTQNIRDLPWHGTFEVDEIYPRCYRIGSEAERNTFIEDFKLTAAISILKIVAEMYPEESATAREDRNREAKACNQSQSELITKAADDTQDKYEQLQVTDLDSRSETSSRGRSFAETELIVVEPESTNPSNGSHVKGSETSQARLRKNSVKLEVVHEGEALSSNPETDREIQNTGIRPASKTARAAMSNQVLSSRTNRNQEQVPVTVLVHAIAAARYFLQEQDMEFLDEPVLETEEYLGFDDFAWQEFLTHYYKVAHAHCGIEDSASYVSECAEVIDLLRPLIPMFDCEGTRNVWICKPGALSRGRGITCNKNLDEILKMVPSMVGVREGQLVVQRYIERPLLIYNTKFDIRQWFLVTDWNPLTIWFYQKSYVRLCSQLYTLDNLQPQYHLSNQSVQHHYENQKNRPKELPSCNMLTSEEFAEYLRNQGHGDVFYDVIYGKMKDIIVNTMQCCQEVVENRKNSFELYGADFMIGEDLSVWLLEINSSPAMGASTQVTKQFCAEVMEDTLKVVIDRRDNKNASTGSFELAIKQNAVSAPPYTGQNLVVEGVQIKKPVVAVPRALYVPQVPSRFNMTQRDRSKDESLQSQSSASFSVSGSLYSRSHQSMSANHSRNPHRDRSSHITSDDSEVGASTSQGVVQSRFSRHSFDKTTTGSDHISQSSKPRTIPEIDSNSHLLKLPPYMLPAKNRTLDTLNPKAIPFISPDSNLIKPTAASKNKTQASEIEQIGPNIGEAWGKMKLTSAQNAQSNVAPPPILIRDKPNPPKVTAQLEMSRLQANRFNTISVTDFSTLRPNHRLVSPKKQTLVFGSPGSKPRDPSKSYSVIEGSSVQHRPLFSTNDFASLVQTNERSLFQRLAEAPRITSKKTLPVKIMYPKYRMPKSDLFGLNDRPVYFLAPVKSGLPFDM